MKKIMFNDKYRLTAAVLNGTKTMTRRVIQVKTLEKCGNIGETALDYAPYKVGEVVAIAQSRSKIFEELKPKMGGWGDEDEKYLDIWQNTPSWNNKLFVAPEGCIHHFKITNIRVERLQDITEEDCLKEGVKRGNIGYYVDGLYVKDWEKESHQETEDGKCVKLFPTAREVFAALIDKVGKKGTWGSNPWVYVYSFEVVD